MKFRKRLSVPRKREWNKKRLAPDAWRIDIEDCDFEILSHISFELTCIDYRTKKQAMKIAQKVSNKYDVILHIWSKNRNIKGNKTKRKTGVDKEMKVEYIYPENYGDGWNSRYDKYFEGE